MYLVTGGAGFIGSHLATRLVRDGHRVRVLDNFSGGKLANLAHIIDEIELLDGDIRDLEIVRRAVSDVEVVFHEAAEPSVPRSIADPATTMAVNVTGTLNLLMAARDAGCRRLVLASTCAVYGDSPVSPKAESLLPSPLSPYAISKLTGEHLCSVFTHVHGFETVALRYFNVFGPRQDPASAYAAVVPRFLAALEAGEAPTIYGDGEQSRDFVFVEDVVNANLLAARTAGAVGKVFNVASGRSVTVNQVLDALMMLTGRYVRPVHEPARAGDIRHSLADVSEARTGLGFIAKTSFDEGLAHTVGGVVEAVLFAPSIGAEAATISS